MKVIKADHERCYEIPGVPGPARRPVDIDASTTGFTKLRSLRVYRFDAGATIDGHAEEDEVFVIIISGSVEMMIGFEESSVDAAGVFTLTAPTEKAGVPFVAYLPPNSVYRLTPRTAADVAYARSTPQESQSPLVFPTDAVTGGGGITTLLEERTHARRLRLKVAHIEARENDVTLAMVDEADAAMEALVHVQGSPAENIARVYDANGVPSALASWDTVALGSGEHASLTLSASSTALIVTVLAV